MEVSAVIKTRKPSEWMEALKRWNAGKPSWSMPKKGSSDYDAVRALMGKPQAAPQAAQHVAPQVMLPPPLPKPKQRRPAPLVAPGPCVVVPTAPVAVVPALPRRPAGSLPAPLVLPPVDSLTTKKRVAK